MLPNNLKQKIALAISMIMLSLVYAYPAQALAAVNGGAGINNPLDNGNNDMTITDLITNVINFLLGLVAVLALLALVIGGIYIILGFANEEYVKQGKSIIKWAIIGLIIVGAAYAILQTAVGILGL